MMSEREKILQDRGYPIGYPPPKPDAMIVPAVIDADIAYISGHVSIDLLDPTRKYIGKVPSQISVADATRSAEICAANLLRAAHFALGSLDRIERVIRVTGYVNADPDFTDAHLVIMGASQLLVEVLGEQGRHARTALGMGQLPLGVATEVEMFVKVRK